MHLLKILDLTEKQVLEIFDLADTLKSKGMVNKLQGKTGVLFFPESSIRTRITFEKGITDLGGHSIIFPPPTLDKREKLEDVIKYIENWADFVIVRHSDFNKLDELAKYSSIPIINAMTSENHPCEILSDLYSLRTIRKDYRQLTYTFVGEAGNISKSWVNAAKVLDLKLNHVCTQGNEIKDNDSNYSFTTELEEVLPKSDILLTDPLSSEMKTKEYIEKYQITLERMQKTQKNSLLNPCPPFYRGEEVSEDAINSDYFVGYGFKENLVYLQQAVILYCLGIS
ncbi:ornithine carbamoyltransferase [Alkaliphilus serpentinus]|uniref:Ornithine carbamoyltransferase n=1 Tax=Alkaliphilus serpentinus TaxID=1482731 RepID=A0A833M9W2_9FIRM|nr:ornithine carbamoyltransferase [Alkaliphilus serpentinus]KAB3529419.1 ornithine carbamoyltransferase [Alkaliphilus serpentinus]